MRMPTSGRPRLLHRARRRARQKKRERAGPKGLHQSNCGVGDSRDKGSEHGVVLDWPGDVDDDRVPGWALLGLKDAGNGCAIECIGAKPVDGLSWKGDEAAGTKIAAARAMASCASSVSRRAGSTARRKCLHISYCHLSRVVPPRKIASEVYSLLTWRLKRKSSSGCGDRSAGAATEGIRFSISILHGPLKATCCMTRRTERCVRAQRSCAFEIMRDDGR